MKQRVGQLVFLCAFVAALALYALSAPDGLPWNGSTHLARAYLGEIVRLPAMPHPFWGFHVRVFGGAVALSVFMAALAAGLLAALVNRHFGWRFAAGAALAWTFLPDVWNRAVTGQRGVCLAAMAVVAAWVLNAVLLRVMRTALAVRRSNGKKGLGGLASNSDANARRERLNRLAGWTVLGASVLFALVSLTQHDYRFGEVAGVFARGVVDAAAGRIIVMNGICDDQVETEARKRGEEERREVARCASASDTRAFGVIALRNDEAYRTNLVAWVRSAFPDETNLWVAARVGAEAFAAAAAKAHPDRFHLMCGLHGTSPSAAGGGAVELAKWERRWEAFKPCLGSSDPFVPVARRMFGWEGNGIANAMLDDEGPGEGRKDASRAAWHLYKRVYDEVDPGNFSALVNMNEMIRRGHAVSEDEEKHVQGRLETFCKDAGNRARLREIARAAGPVRADSAQLEKMIAEAKKRIAEKIAAGEKVEIAPEVLTLVEWNNEMVKLMNRGELVRAGRIARTILTNPKWLAFIPANAVMGVVTAKEGDYAASEAFFRVATETTNRVPTVVLNDYADTLLHLGKRGEAERMARRAVKESDEKFWMARLTLAEVLEKNADAASAGDEIKSLLQSVLSHAPAPAREKIRKEHRGFVR